MGCLNVGVFFEIRMLEFINVIIFRGRFSDRERFEGLVLQLGGMSFRSSGLIQVEFVGILDFEFL